MNDKQLAYRIRVLPDQLARARARVLMLEREAARLGMWDILTEPQARELSYDQDPNRRANEPAQPDIA